MTPNRREFEKQCTFQKFCKSVLHNEALVIAILYGRGVELNWRRIGVQCSCIAENVMRG